MDRGIIVAKKINTKYREDRWCINGYGSFGTLYHMDMHELERLFVDLGDLINEVKGGLFVEEVE